MKSRTFSAVCALALIVTASPVLADATLSPGKNSAYTKITSIPATTSYTSLASVQILKGKRKRILEVDIAFSERSLAVGSVRGYATVNGVEMEPAQANAQAAESCVSNWITCTVSGTYWADLDLLEASFPGQFVGVPLTIEAYGLKTVAGNMGVTMRARLMKK